MQINRLFEMVYLLMGRKKMTAKELSDHFEVSQRTIYRDIEILNGAGIPVAANKGKGGGIELPENFLLDADAFSGEERSEIIFALQSFKALKSVNADSVLKKLSAIFNKGSVDWIEVDFSDWSPTGKEKFNVIKSAIIEKKCLALDYFGANGDKTHRTVYPMQLWFKHKAWYIKAFCLMRRDYRLFRISRIKNPVMNESNFEIADFLNVGIPRQSTGTDETANTNSINNISEEFLETQPEINSQKSKSAENITGNNVDLKMKIDAIHAHRVYDEFEEESIRTNPDGNFIVSAVFPEDEWLYGYILSFGSGAEVLEPLDFKDKIISKIKMMMERYV